MTIVSYSEVFKWQTCHRQYYYAYDLDRRPLEMSDAIRTGVKGHKLLQNFHELLRAGKNKDEALQATLKSATALIREEGFSNGDLLKAWTCVDNYIRKTDFTSEAILVENRFLIPVSSLSDDPELAHVEIGFTPDVVFERKGKKLDVEDYKFIARRWSKSKINRFPQLKLYQIFLQHMGYDVSRTILRFFHTNDGKDSSQNYTLSPAEAKILTRDFLAGVKEVVKHKEGALQTRAEVDRTMNYTACQYCAYEFVCSLEAQGKDATKSLNSLYKKSDYDYNK